MSEFENKYKRTNFVILDTETTGLSTRDNHKIVEIGCVRVVNGKEEEFHRYLNPKRPVPKESTNIHGLTDEFLKDKPFFETIAQELVEFIGPHPLIIHNAPFDLEFLNYEFKVIGHKIDNEIIDTLVLAKEKFPFGSNSLDSLCERFRVNNKDRTFHGALLDSKLLKEVYYQFFNEMTYNFNQTKKDLRGFFKHQQERSQDLIDKLRNNLIIQEDKQKNEYWLKHNFKNPILIETNEDSDETDLEE